MIAVERQWEVLVNNRTSQTGHAYVAVSEHPTIEELDMLLEILVMRRNIFAEIEQQQEKEKK